MDSVGDERFRPVVEARFWAKVDKTETCWLWTGSKMAGYGEYRTRRKLFNSRRAHRIAYEMLVGPIPEGMMLDHVCHVTACVNPAHLRPVNSKQNQENRLGANARNRWGERGVEWDSRCRCWRTHVMHGGTRIRGRYETFEEAVAAVREVRLALYTHNDADRLTA